MANDLLKFLQGLGDLGGSIREGVQGRGYGPGPFVLGGARLRPFLRQGLLEPAQEEIPRQQEQSLSHLPHDRVSNLSLPTANKVDGSRDRRTGRGAFTPQVRKRFVGEEDRGPCE